FGGAGELMTELIYGLAHPQIPGQLAPAQLFAEGCEVTAVETCLMASRILSDIAAGPVFTTKTPSCPTETVMLLPSATSMKMLPWTGKMWTCPSFGLWSAIFLSTANTDRDDGTFRLATEVDPFNVSLYSG